MKFPTSIDTVSITLIPIKRDIKTAINKKER